MGTLAIVPFRSEPPRVRVTRVPGGNGSGVGSVRFRMRPQVRPPSNRIDFGKHVMGRRPSSSLKIAGR
eukprot:scaffold75832_cov39-Cyclotella_meneghiniana.AAC.10